MVELSFYWRVPMTTNWDKFSEDERRKLSERHLNGDYFKHRLIRFGYLSVVERQRLVQKYPNLEERFERGLDSETKLQIAVLAFFVYLVGIMVGTALAEPGWAAVVGLAVAIVAYWFLALWLLNETSKAEKERNERFSEWRQ